MSGNLHVGFGSFVEKNLPPFTSSVPSFNCPAENPNCTPPYSYYHKVTLSEMDAEEFKWIKNIFFKKHSRESSCFFFLIKGLRCWPRHSPATLTSPRAPSTP